MSGCIINNNSFGMIPVLSTSSGACLTAANWQESGVKAVSFHLASLLVKPGYNFLKELPELATYTGWQATTVLNASLPRANKEGVYTLRSPFDGSIIRHTVDEIIALITQLQPQFVILPQGILSCDSSAWQSLPQVIFPFFPLSDLPKDAKHRPFGVYFCCEQTTSLPDVLQQIAEYNDLPSYIGGELSLSAMQSLIAAGASYVESDLPASDACEGTLYSQAGIFSLSAPDCAQQFELIDPNCHCPTCDQQFTRAHLHHLLGQTPLLCQRFLVQHNVHFAQSKLLHSKTI